MIASAMLDRATQFFVIGSRQADQLSRVGNAPRTNNSTSRGLSSWSDAIRRLFP